MGNKMSLLPSIDLALASLNGHRRIRNKRRRFRFQDPLVTNRSDESFLQHECAIARCTRGFEFLTSIGKEFTVRATD